MSKTPRTDEHLRMKEENGHAVIVSRDFARQLETELVEARAVTEHWKSECNALQRILNKLQTGATGSADLQMTIVDRQGHVVTQGAFNHYMAALDEARGRAKQLSEEWDSLASRMQILRKAAQLYREASIQDHAEHWDSKQTGGANCPVCLWASELRREADALVDIANAGAQAPSEA